MRALSICALSVALVMSCASAGADVFEPIQLASTNAVEQADYAHDPVISADGRYVAFDGSFGGITGVWRRDLATGVVEQVAPGDAELPSISEDGRYVSFTTTVALDPKNDTNRGPDVYVRDMSIPAAGPCPLERDEATEPCAFSLASAVDDSTQGLSYEYSVSGEETRYGALASGRSALSADGRQVAFVTTAASNLAGAHTPALQVAVRNLDTKRTILVSVLDEPGTGKPKLDASGQNEPVPSIEGYGAVYPGGSQIPSFPGAGDAGASISADGTTVVWMAQEIEEQAQVLPAEPNLSPSYSEPLWRRIADGAQAPTRRITGGGDPTNPACAQSGETRPVEPLSLSDPCQGPFEQTHHEGSTGIWTLGAAADYLPRLSANGQIVAFVANAREIASGEEFRFAESSDDLYVVNMADGLTRVQALRRLTEIAGGEAGDLARGGKILDLDVSPDGSEVAFCSLRTVFPLGSPAFVSPPAGAPGMVELFDVDLVDDTLTRVTQGFEGQPSEQPHSEVPPGQDPYTEQEGAFSPSFSADGETLAFSSTASNLVYGDGNSPGVGQPPPFDGGDVFVVKRKRFNPTATGAYVSALLASPSLTPTWRLGVTALSRRDGSVLLDVEAPGAGSLRAGARSAVVIRSAQAARAGHRASASAKRPGARMTVATRTVATRIAHPSAGGLITLTLKLARPYAALAGKRGGLSATVSLALSAPGRPVLRQNVAVTFLRTIGTRHVRRGRVAGRRRVRVGARR